MELTLESRIKVNIIGFEYWLYLQYYDTRFIQIKGLQNCYWFYKFGTE